MPGDTLIRFGPFRFDRREARLWRDGSPVDVTPRALGVLEALLERPGELVLKEDLVARVWPRTVVTDAAVAKRVQELRTALGDDPREPKYIQTLYRRGFKFVGDVITETTLATDFVGREAALEQLRRVQRSVANGERGIVLVSGEAGIGKSRLLARFLHECEAAGVQVARGHCSPYGLDQPYLPLAGALSSIARAWGNDYAALVDRHAPSWPRILQGDGDTPSMPVALNRHMLLLELCALIGTLATRGSLVIAIEDLHWSDPSTLIALDALVRDTSPAPLLVVATVRDGALSDDAGWRSLTGQLGHAGHSEVHLARFTRAEVAKYLTARFGDDVAETIANAVHLRSEGLPLYVSWLGDWVRDAAPQATGDADVTQPTLPDSLARLFELQLTAQRSEALEALEAASVLGPEFSVESLAQVMDERVQSTEALLREVLRGSGILTVAGGARAQRFAFAHGLLHDTLYRRIESARLRRLHLRCAELFDTARGDDPGEAARHFALSGEPIRAAQMRLAAAAAALATHSVEEARRHFEGALAELRSVAAVQRRDDLEIDALLGLANCLVALDGYGSSDVQGIYASALALSRHAATATQRFDAVSGLRGHLVMCARLVEAAGHDEALFEAAHACGDDVSLASAFTLRAENRMYRGNLAEAGADLAEAERLLAGIPDDLARREAWWWVSINMRQIAAQYAAERNELDRAMRHRDAVVVLLGRDPNPYLECLTCFFSVAVHMSREEVALATPMTARMIELAQTHGFDQLLIWAKTIHGYLLCTAGDHAAGVAEIREGLARFDASGTRLSRPLIMSSLGVALAQSGALQEALGLFETAQRSIERNGERMREPVLHMQRAAALAAAHVDPAEVRAALEQSLQCARTLGFRNIELRTLTRIVARGGDRAEELRELLATMTEGADTPVVRAAYEALTRAN